MGGEAGDVSLVRSPRYCKTVKELEFSSLSTWKLSKLLSKGMSGMLRLADFRTSLLWNMD